MQNVANIKQTYFSGVSESIVLRHIKSFIDNDLEAVMTDYTDKSVLITQEATYTGPGEIRDFFKALMIHFPKQQSSFELDKIAAIGTMVYIVWHASSPGLDVPLGSDTFVIKDDKIFQQTFAGQLSFKG